MTQKEQLIEKIELERGKLNQLLGGSEPQEIYLQSLVVDQLIEQYMEIV